MITNKNQCTIRLLPDTIAIIPTLRFALDPAALTLLNASLDSDDPPDLELRAQIAPSRESVLPERLPGRAGAEKNLVVITPLSELNEVIRITSNAYRPRRALVLLSNFRAFD
ncbi:MAG: hypothetical protein AAB408_02445, partial [Patescibacteria group bacterium]